jgi:hypothetical protein
VGFHFPEETQACLSFRAGSENRLCVSKGMGCYLQERAFSGPRAGLLSGGPGELTQVGPHQQRCRFREIGSFSFFREGTTEAQHFIRFLMNFYYINVTPFATLLVKRCPVKVTLENPLKETTNRTICSKVCELTKVV